MKQETVNLIMGIIIFLLFISSICLWETKINQEKRIELLENMTITLSEGYSALVEAYTDLKEPEKELEEYTFFIH